MSDPHALLGLPAGANAQQIKRAFRKLAMQWHPDRNPDPAAAEQFRRLRDAHDRLLATLLGDAADATYEDKTAAHAPPQRGADRWQTLEISIEESFSGALRTVEDGRRYLYYPAIKEDEYKAEAATQFIDRVFSGRAAPLVAHLADSRGLTSEDIAELEKLLGELKK